MKDIEVVMEDFRYEIPTDAGTVVFTADISLFINEDYAGNKYPEVEYNNQKVTLEYDVANLWHNFIIGNDELEQAALEQLTGE